MRPMRPTDATDAFNNQLSTKLKSIVVSVFEMLPAFCISHCNLRLRLKCTNLGSLNSLFCFSCVNKNKQEKIIKCYKETRYGKREASWLKIYWLFCEMAGLWSF